jgi:hypothetical protein
MRKPGTAPRGQRTTHFARPAVGTKQAAAFLPRMPDAAWEALARELDLVVAGHGPSWFERYTFGDLDQARRAAARHGAKVCTVSLWGSEWWCHEGIRAVQPVAYVVAKSVSQGFRRRLQEPDEV